MRTITVLSALLLVAGCSSSSDGAPATTDAPTTTVDREAEKFRTDSEKFIEGFDVAEQAGQAFTGAECDTPDRIAPNVTYSCTATGEDGTAWSFDLEVTGELEFTVTRGAPVGS